MSTDENDDGRSKINGNGGSIASIEKEKERKDSSADGMRTQYTMDLNVAYESLEVMRKLNVQIEFGECVDVDQCVSCLREMRQDGGNAALPPKRWRKRSSDKKATPCLSCGSPMCYQHSSKEFYKQHITICHKCSHLFAPDVIATAIMSDGHLFLNYVLEVYDRALLILRYSAQYIDEVAQALERNTKRNNKIGLGSSTTGVMAGVVGVAAAATIWTPVGPPLLLASILFGSGATAAAAGSEAVNYRCEPNQMANKIITLHSILSAIVLVPVSMDLGNANKASDVGATNKSSLHWARATMNGLKPLTLGTMSAISVVTEAREVNKIVKKMRAGSPCERAEELKRIKLAIQESIMDTTDFAAYLTKVIDRHSKESAPAGQPPLLPRQVKEN